MVSQPSARLEHVELDTVDVEVDRGVAVAIRGRESGRGAKVFDETDRGGSEAPGRLDDEGDEGGGFDAVGREGVSVPGALGGLGDGASCTALGGRSGQVFLHAGVNNG